MVRQLSWCKNASLVRFPTCDPLLDHSTFDVELCFSSCCKDTAASDSQFIAQSVLTTLLKWPWMIKWVWHSAYPRCSTAWKPVSIGHQLKPIDRFNWNFHTQMKLRMAIFNGKLESIKASECKLRSLQLNFLCSLLSEHLMKTMTTFFLIHTRSFKSFHQRLFKELMNVIETKRQSNELFTSL